MWKTLLQSLFFSPLLTFTRSRSNERTTTLLTRLKRWLRLPAILHREKGFSVVVIVEKKYALADKMLLPSSFFPDMGPYWGEQTPEVIFKTFFFFLQLRHYDRQVAELRETNESLYDRLESLSRQSSYASTASSNAVNQQQHMSLLNELEMSSTSTSSRQPHPFRRYVFVCSFVFAFPRLINSRETAFAVKMLFTTLT